MRPSSVHEGVGLFVRAPMVAPTQNGFNQKRANRITAQVIPIVLAGIVAYASWVMIKLVSGQESRAKIY